MSDLNVLVLSVGRRVELVQYLKKALARRNLSFRIVGADASHLAPALYECDTQIILPKVSEGHYLEILIETIKSQNINIVIPTIDTELGFLARHKSEIETQTHATVIISKFKTIEIFQDKLKTAQFLEDNQILSPKILDYSNRTQFEYPVFIKPAEGSSSINARMIKNQNELERWVETIEKPIVQSYVRGKEYTVDVYIDRNNKLISESHRFRIKTRSGEILIGQVLFIDQIHEIILELLSKIELFGPITLQFIEENDQFYLIEINPRLGGGVPMSLDSGIDILGNLIDEYSNKTLAKTNSKGLNKIFSRFDQMIEVKKND